MKTLQFSLIFFALCNVGFFLVVWLKQIRSHRSSALTIRSLLCQHLCFSDGQISMYDELILPYEKDLNKLTFNIKRYRQMLSDNFDNVKARNVLCELIENNQRIIDLVRYNHYLQVRKLCTELQKIKLDSVIGDAFLFTDSKEKAEQQFARWSRGIGLGKKEYLC